jgi:hypothetical protein
MKQRIFLTVFLLLMATGSYPAMAQITITLDRAEINGQDITTSRQIVVQPGEPLSGYLEVTVQNSEPIGTTVPGAATPNWWWNGYRTNTHLFHRGHPGARRPIDTNALDVSSWSSVYWNQAVSGDGSVEGFKFCSGPTCVMGIYGAAAIMVQVASGQVEKELTLPPTADTIVSSSNRRYWDYRSPYPTYEKYANYGNLCGLAIVRGKFGMCGSFSDWRASLILFDLSEAPLNATVEEANLCLYQYMVWGEQVSVHRMKKDWKELEVSWYEQYKGGEL